ncbi:GNAT family N-acetyltransferase [Methylosinus sp. LW4]|uniref:GNAT family N-acetyltransferase n=1 Tax=Methylosinus sp. LW4 TaxID=136993 RepID=UPI0009FCED78|nr:GNAT family N-acetyltransferase [Methylosinus sp. LW4]
MGTDPFRPLETTRLLLRCVVADDAVATAMMMTPEVSRWVAYWPVPFTYEMAVARIEAAREWARRGDALPFAVTDKAANGDLIGWVMIYRDEENRRRGSLGYWFGEKHHGKGYMRELAPIALAAGFDLLDLDVIEAAAQPENAASIAVMKACGMKPTGEGMVYAPARERHELCHFYEVQRPRALA